MKHFSNEIEELSFLAVDSGSYDNIGASSIFEIDFENRPLNDPDRNRESIQYAIQVSGRRFEGLKIPAPDILLMDCEGAELSVLKGFGEMLISVQAIVLESSMVPRQKGAPSFREIDDWLQTRGWRLVASSLGGGRHHFRARLALGGFRQKLASKGAVRDYFGLFDVLDVNPSASLVREAAQNS